MRVKELVTKGVCLMDGSLFVMNLQTKFRDSSKIDFFELKSAERGGTKGRRETWLGGTATKERLRRSWDVNFTF